MSSPTPPVPRTALERAALDRAALERVLARAAELQSQDAAEPGGALTDEQVVDLGKEVGLTPHAIRQAIAEERGRAVVPEAPGLLGSMFGPPTISAARAVPMAAAAVLPALDQVMGGELAFAVSRRFPTRVQWTPKRGFLDLMRKQLAHGDEDIDLRAAEEVAASVVPVDAQSSHVRLDATLAAARRGAVATTSAVTVLAALGAGVVSITGAPLLLILPLFGGGAALGYAQSRASYRRTALRVSRGLEQLLDRLEFGPARRRENFVDKLFR